MVTTGTATTPLSHASPVYHAVVTPRSPPVIRSLATLRLDTTISLLTHPTPRPPYSRPRLTAWARLAAATPLRPTTAPAASPEALLVDRTLFRGAMVIGVCSLGKLYLSPGWDLAGRNP